VVVAVFNRYRNDCGGVFDYFLCPCGCDAWLCLEECLQSKSTDQKSKQSKAENFALDVF